MQRSIDVFILYRYLLNRDWKLLWTRVIIYVKRIEHNLMQDQHSTYLWKDNLILG